MTKPQLKELAQQTINIIAAGQYTNAGGRVKNLQWYIDRSRIHTGMVGPEWVYPELPDINHKPVVEVTTESTIWAMRRLMFYDCDPEKLGCLNFASAKNPGGGFTWGTMAQEESLAYSSTLYASLLAAPYFYDHHKQLEKEGQPPLYTNSVIISPYVTFFRNDKFEFLDHPFSATVLTCAAPKTVDIKERFPGALEQVPIVIKQRMELIFRVAIDSGITHFVLGAWGCGIFQNDPIYVAECFKEMLEKYGRFFEHIVFAIYGGGTNYDAFKSILTP